MPTFLDKLRANQQTTLSQYYDPNNDSSARKYVSTDAVQNNSPTDSTTNAEHIVTTAAGLKTTALAVEQIAAQAMQQILATQQQLTSVVADASATVRQSLVVRDEQDVSNNQQQLATAASALFLAVPDAQASAALVRRTQQLVDNARHGTVQPRAEEAVTRTFNTLVPDIEEVQVDIDKNTSAVDNFYVGITFNLALQQSELAAVRIFRAVLADPPYTRPLATLSAEGIQRLQSYRGRKNEDMSQNQMLLDENGIPNAVSNLNYFDPYTGQRVQSPSTSQVTIPTPVVGTNSNPQVVGTEIPESLQRLDRSVINDVNTLANLQSNPIYGFEPGVELSGVTVGSNVNLGFILGNKQQRQVDSLRSNSVFVIDQSNKLEFSEIAYITPDKLKSRRIGTKAEYVFYDESVSYGKGYKYFIVTVDKQLQQSSRSNIVTAVIEGLRIPERPRSVITSIGQTRIGLSVGVNDQLVEKFEVHRFEDAVNRATAAIASTIADPVGFTQREYLRKIADNNYMLIGECMNGQKTGGAFSDNSVIPGRRYVYRVYSVDIFGNKSESPYEVEAYVPDLEQQFVYLATPSILTEVDSQSAQTKITIRCDDTRIRSLRVERRDLTLGQDAFTVPYTPPRTVIGPGRLAKGRRALEGERVYEQSSTDIWTGVLLPQHGRDQVMRDPWVSWDHVYQYRVYGYDDYGNRTSYALSSPTMVVRRQFVNSPVGLTASMTQSNGVLGVAVSWIDGNQDKSAEDLIGSQSALSESFVRTLFQVQRLKIGESIWRNFPLMSATKLFDPIVGEVADVAPNFRPEYPDYNQMYLYRVQSIQTGAFISNFTQPTSVFTGLQMYQPLNFIIRTPSVTRRPFFAMLNWDTYVDSGVVDYWEIERAVVNNFAAARLNLKNTDDLANLAFKSYRKVYRESSRFISKTHDKGNDKTELITGQHCFMDTQLDFGNTYFYRIRAVSPQGNVSRWSYKGLKLTSTAFEQKWVPVLTDEEKQELASTYEPMILGAVNRKDGKSTLSLQPEYSRSDSSRATPRIVFNFDRSE